MSEDLAAVFVRRLLSPQNTDPLPFLDRVVGLTRLHETRVPDGEELRTVRVPVPVSFTADDCQRDPRYLVPDQGTASILWFEDGGSVPFSQAANLHGWITTLTLKLWLNPARLNGELSDASIINALDRALRLRYQSSDGPFSTLKSDYTVLPGGPGVVSAYTFDTPMLYPPYKLLSLEIKARYLLSKDCYQADLPTIKPLESCSY